MNNQPPKVLYETVGKLAGINVLFDPQMQPGKNANLDLNNVTLQEALDYIALLTKTFWKPVSANAIFVTEDNVTKRRDYEDEVVKVFYLKNPTSTQEFSGNRDRGAIGDRCAPHVPVQRARTRSWCATRWTRWRWWKSCCTIWTSPRRKWWWT